MSRAAQTLVALDVDGTIMSFDGRISDDVRAAVTDLRAAGAQVVLATGRAVTGTLPVARQLGLDTGWVVCSNGAVTARLDPALAGGWEPVDVVRFDPGPVLRVLAAEMPDVLVAVEDLGRGFLVSAPFPLGELDGEVRVMPLGELAARPATRVVLRAPERGPEDFHALVERVGLREVSYAVGWSAWLDLTPAGVSKASALEGLRRRLGVEPHTTVAVGDGGNDLEMLAWAARGVAMGHAAAEVRAVADEVTGTIDDDGLVPVLRSLLQ